jgi:hypothetical protein
VTHSDLPKHAGLNFIQWAPARSKAAMQAFVDFLVACRKDQNGEFCLVFWLKGTG